MSQPPSPSPTTHRTKFLNALTALRTTIQSLISNPKSQIPQILLSLLIISYTLYFSWYSINRHNTLNSYAADLSLIDQPMWNAALGPGDFMELTWGARQQPRLAEHFEPILIPLAGLFFIWDDVRILLIAQTAAVALGALPVFWIAGDQLTISNDQLTNPESKIQNLKSKIPPWVALAFAVTYLLSPHLQAANIADFHADPFVVTPFLFAFWYTTQKRWPWMWLWAIIAMLTKETLPSLTAMLGLYLIINHYYSKPTQSPQSIPQIRHSQSLHGLALFLLSSLWFLVATFLVVAPLARQYFGTDGPIYLANRFQDGPADLPRLLQDPARWRYLFGLFAAVGFLPLLAPELLILGLPVLAANLLSSFPGQYSGEQHYSAPLVAAFIIAAIYGCRRLIDRFSLNNINHQPLRMSVLMSAGLWLLTWSLAYHALWGWTPLSIRLETYRPDPASTRLPGLIAQIPPEAVVSASAAIHPHLAHRRVEYVFPIVQDAAYLLVDVTDIPGTHPNDAHAQIMTLLDTDWHLFDAVHGLILARKSSPAASPVQLPPAFYDFARSSARPTNPADLTFGAEALRFLGYDLSDDPDDGVVFRFYWQARRTLPANLKLWPLVYDDLGRLVSDPGQVPLIALVWYPPGAWQPGETIVTETLPQHLPDTFHLGLAAGPEGSLADPALRWPITGRSPGSRLYPGHWVQLATLHRQGPFLNPQPAVSTLHSLTAADIQFGPAIRLTGHWFDGGPLEPGAVLPILLQWTATRPPQADFTVFLHLLAPDGQRVAQSDAVPTWLAPMPTSQWPLDQPLLDQHLLTLPDNLPPATYELQLGLYHAQTLKRLTLPDGRDIFPLGQIQVK